MDTLVIGADDRMPMSFQRKFLAIPDSDLVVAGTGHAGFINGWFQHIQTNLGGANIDELDTYASNIFCESVQFNGGLSGLTATIYHFGYSSQEEGYVGYAYRSEQNFRSEKIQQSVLGFKPVVPVTLNGNICFPDSLIEIILEQQRLDHLQPSAERVGIGGEIEFVVMSERTIHVETVYRFSSYEAESIHIEQRTDA